MKYVWLLSTISYVVSKVSVSHLTPVLIRGSYCGLNTSIICTITCKQKRGR